MPQDRPQIPSAIKREVRQRCGFGCVICGKPIFEYEHMLGWSKVKRHVASEITLLCPDHHDAKTRGFLPNEKVVTANNNPRNKQVGASKPYALEFSGTSYLIRMGYHVEVDANYKGPIAQALVIDGDPLLWLNIQDGHYLLNLLVFDSSNRLVLFIDDNELVLNAHSWDIELVGTRLRIRESLGNILFDIVFTPPSTVTIRQGYFIRNGVEVLILPEVAVVLNSRNFFQIIFRNITAGLVVGETPLRSGGSSGVRVTGVPRERWDREESISWARKLAKSLKESDEDALNELLRSPTMNPPR